MYVRLQCVYVFCMEYTTTQFVYWTTYVLTYIHTYICMYATYVRNVHTYVCKGSNYVHVLHNHKPMYL